MIHPFGRAAIYKCDWDISVWAAASSVRRCIGIEGDPRLAKDFKERVLLPDRHYIKERRIILAHITRNSQMTLACGIEHSFETECPYFYNSDCSEDDGKVVFCVDAQPGVPIRLLKYMTYHTSRNFPTQELCDRAERTLDRAISHGFDDLLAS
ncbi:MAG: hypothetical protein N4J56_002234 [Chroococcidiopsis sp. SAG 2025]|uniref:hypothetical protein n=1 Tax=Chroococcidiopsis sp. SAG 2025 TaxID=171389 RepID=UPI00293746EC|nr:hypothetical protein [Chroococcidiopsis sp. SAG 2025]MDV2992580.1 hypothetical protein [Chroococcidiopsis sp. SAG 2025]